MIIKGLNNIKLHLKNEHSKNLLNRWEERYHPDITDEQWMRYAGSEFMWRGINRRW